MPAEQFDFRRVVDAMEMAHADGLEPERIYLGLDEQRRLLTDTNFARAKSMTHKSTSVGMIAGIEVSSAPEETMAIMTAKEDDYVGYYLI